MFARCENQGLQISYWHNGCILILKHSPSREIAIHAHLCTAAAQSVIKSLCRTSQLLQCVLWLIPQNIHQGFFFSQNLPSPDYFFHFIHSKCLAYYVCIYLFMHCVIFCRKSLNNTNTGNVNENDKFVMLKVPSQSASVLLCLPETREFNCIILAKETSHRWVNVVWLTC